MVHAATFSSVVYQLRVMLEYIDPPIWRRLRVPGRFTLAQPHAVIQEDRKDHAVEVWKMVNESVTVLVHFQGVAGSKVGRG